MIDRRVRVFASQAVPMQIAPPEDQTINQSDLLRVAWQDEKMLLANRPREDGSIRHPNSAALS